MLYIPWLCPCHIFSAPHLTAGLVSGRAPGSSCPVALCLIVLAMNMMGCSSKVPKNENVAQTLSTDSGHLVGVGSNDSGMAWPKVILLGSPSSIIIGQPVNLSIKLSHPQHKWIVTSYFMAQQQISDTDQGDRGGDDVKEVPAGGEMGGGVMGAAAVMMRMQKIKR